VVDDCGDGCGEEPAEEASYEGGGTNEARTFLVEPLGPSPASRATCKSDA
jgi:hypothetical protein